MKSQSTLFARSVRASLIALFLMVFWVFVLYMGIGRLFFARTQANLLAEKAKLAALWLLPSDGSLAFYPGLLENQGVSLADIWDCDVMLFDASGTLIHAKRQDGMPAHIYPQMQGALTEALGGASITETFFAEDIDRQLVLVSAPLVQGDKTLGAVVLLKPAAELSASMGILSLVLLLALALAGVFMVPFLSWHSRKLARPLLQMRDTALAMAGGDFTAHAPEGRTGELGQLAGALNHLSAQLCQTLNDLTLERNRVLQILMGIRQGIAAVDAQGNVTHFNPAALRQFGHGDVADLSNKTQLIPHEHFWAMMDTALSGGETQNGFLYQGEQTLLASVSPLRDDGARIAGAVALFQDITQAQRLEKTRRDYVANVSHELRTPLTALRALLEPLCDGLVKKEADIHRYHEKSLDEVLRLSQLIDDLLELSRLQNQPGKPVLSQVPLAGLLDQAIDRVTPLFKARGIRLELAPLDLNAKVLTEPDRLLQILMILLDNALKHTPPEGSVRIEAIADEDKWLISVSDTGSGIAPEHLPHVFERFYKADTARTSGGTGLGLAIARELLERMQEHIDVQSTPGKGSRFVFTASKAP